MQSLVEDVNAAVMAYRRIGTSALEQGDPDKAVFAVDGLMQLLMDDFSLSYSEFSTLESLERERKAIECGNAECRKAIFLDGTEITHRSAASGYRFFMPPKVSIMKMTLVECPDCGKKTEFADEDCFVVRDRTKVRNIPYPPSVDNVLSQTYTGRKFWKWFRAVWNLVEGRHREQRESIKVKEDEI